MARMQRATIEEAAKSLGVTQSDIELQIKSGSLVPCQDPLFRRCVWISESAKPKLKRAAKSTLKKDIPTSDTSKNDLDSASLVKPATDDELPQKTELVLEPELEIRKPRAKRKAKETPENDAQENDSQERVTPKIDSDSLGFSDPDQDFGLLLQTVALFNTELAINKDKARRKAKDTKETPKQGVGPVEIAEPSKETGLLQKTVDLLHTGLEITPPKLRRKATETPERNTPRNYLDLFDSGEPAKAGLLQKTVDLLNTELEITAPKLKRKAKETPEKDSPEIDNPQFDADLLGLNHPDNEIGLLLQTVAMLNAELEISEAEARQKAKDTKETTKQGVDSVGLAEPAKETGLLQKTVDLLNTELEITPPKLKRKAKATSEKATPEKAAPKKDGESVGLAKLAKEMELLQETVAMLKAELEIREERLDLLSVQLESTRDEVRKLRPLLGERLESRSNEVEQLRSLLGSIQSSEQAHKIEPYEPSPTLPVFADAVDPIDDEIHVTVTEAPEPGPPIRAGRLSYASIFRRSFRPFIGLMCLGFGLPLFR